MTSAFGEMPSSRATFFTSARNGGIAADTSLRDGLAVAGRFDVALAEVQHVTARLHLARAPQILLRHRDVGEQVGAATTTRRVAMISLSSSGNASSARAQLSLRR